MIRSPIPARPQGAIRPLAVAWGVLFLALTTLSTSVSCALAQNIARAPLSVASAAATPTPAAATPAKLPSVVATQPVWQQLTSQQQLALRPLAANWASLSEAHKRKWLAVSRRYNSLSAAEQTKMHSRMAGWVSLSQRQRTEARLSYAQTKQLTPAEKAATWQAYQALSAEERQRLAAKASSKPAGAATATRPVSPQKLAVVPVTRKTPSRSAHVAAAREAVDQKTLLPRPLPTPDTATQNH
ncbi:DUF3106 domain-containing protein [Rhodoferax sp.]|uniref:DUF3106 domain-containing protein n=1 Tax=Rhodoferax sp. TaxID=50421 RepID=UPI0027518E41|nr:DUF3106 domain-containing protein [Rhodoferax sp.]